MRLLRGLPLLLAMLSCARVVAPSGGPEDRTPPEVVAVEPPPSTSAATLDRIVIRWSERLEESTVEVALYPPVAHRLDVSGSRMAVRLEEPLGDGTLVIHMPPTVSDLHGNASGAPLDLAWSGLDSMPGSAVRVSLGRQGGTVLAERVLVEILDTSGNLVRRTSTDSTGQAAAGWLEPGPHILRCYEDLDYSFSWEPDIEAGAESLLVLAARDTLALALTLGVVDTVGPVLSSVRALDLFHVEVSFNEQPLLDDPSGSAFSVVDTSGAPIAVLGLWSAGARDGRSVILATDRIPGGGTTLRVAGIADLLGNPSEPDSIGFMASDSMPGDTLRVRSMYPPPGAVDAPAGGAISFSLSRWVDPDSVSAHFRLVRVQDSSLVGGTMSRIDARSFSFSPSHELLGDEQYRAELTDGLFDQVGDPLGQFSWSFVSAWGDEPGTVRGRVAGGGNVTLEIRAAGSGGGSYSFGLGPGGDYSVEPVAAGRYTVSAFSDRNGNGTWDPGEPYGAWPGVILVRPGLSTVGIDIEILP